MKKSNIPFCRYLLLLFLVLWSIDSTSADNFRIRTITAGVTLSSLTDTTTISNAIVFLREASKTYAKQGYEIQTVRISTQNLHQLLEGLPDEETLRQLKAIDRIAARENVGIAIGELVDGDQFSSSLPQWVVKLNNETSNLNFSVSISSQVLGIHHKSIKTAALICQALSKQGNGGEANFRFTTSANMPAGTPFFPAAYHEGPNSFAVGLESANLLTAVFKVSHMQNAEQNLRAELEKKLKPIEEIGEKLSKEFDWQVRKLGITLTLKTLT